MEFPLEITDLRDEPRYQRDGTVVHYKRATFYLGKFGPFIERLPNDDNFDYELTRRSDALRGKLQGLHS